MGYWHDRVTMRLLRLAWLIIYRNSYRFALRVVIVLLFFFSHVVLCLPSFTTSNWILVSVRIVRRDNLMSHAGPVFRGPRPHLFMYL